MRYRHYYEVIIDHDICVSFYTNRKYGVGDRRKGKGTDRKGNEISVNGLITSVLEHEGF